MRACRADYEAFVSMDDVIQRRATRATTEATRQHATKDTFEAYLSSMSRVGTYGGHTELQAFARAYDQDVLVHVPPSVPYPDFSVTNYTRLPGSEVRPMLHICFGGEEDRYGHYDSSQRKEEEMRKLVTRTKTHLGLAKNEFNTRAIRMDKADPSKDMMREMRTNAAKEIRTSLDIFNNTDRGRSSSVSSQYSSGSKRSHEEDQAELRLLKRSDRKRSLRPRNALNRLTLSPTRADTRTGRYNSSGPPTPTSSHESESSSETPAENTTVSSTASPRPTKVHDDDDDNNNDDDSDCQLLSIRKCQSSQDAREPERLLQASSSNVASSTRPIANTALQI